MLLDGRKVSSQSSASQKSSLAVGNINHWHRFRRPSAPGTHILLLPAIFLNAFDFLGTASIFVRQSVLFGFGDRTDSGAEDVGQLNMTTTASIEDISRRPTFDIRPAEVLI